MDVPQASLVAPEEEAEEDLFPRVTALPSFKERTYPREAAVLTARDLERAARVHEPYEITYDYQGEILPDGSEVCHFHGTQKCRSDWLSSGIHRLLLALSGSVCCVVYSGVVWAYYSAQCNLGAAQLFPSQQRILMLLSFWCNPEALLLLLTRAIARLV